MKAVWIRRIYYILLSVALAAAGVCLIGGALHIYNSGGAQIYTLEKVNSTFRQIAVPVYIALILVIGAFILELLLPVPKKGKPEKNYAMILQKLQQRANLDQCGDKDLCRMILSLRRQRRVLAILSAVMLGVATVFFLIYALNSSYPSLTDGHAVTEAMVQHALVWGGCMLLPFILGVYTAYATRSGMQTEIELLRHVALQKPPAKAAVKSYAVQKNILRGGLIALALVLIVVGAIGDGWRDVLTKAAAICTECVGLG